MCREIQQKLGIGSSAIIFCITEEQKRSWVDWYRFMSEKLDEGYSKQVFNIVADNESSIYDHDPETTQCFKTNS